MKTGAIRKTWPIRDASDTANAWQIRIREEIAPTSDGTGDLLLGVIEAAQWLRMSRDEVQSAYMLGLFPNATIHLEPGTLDVNLRRGSKLWDTLLIPNRDVDALLRRAWPSIDVGSFVSRIRQRHRDERQKPDPIARGLLVEQTKCSS